MTGGDTAPSGGARRSAPPWSTRPARGGSTSATHGRSADAGRGALELADELVAPRVRLAAAELGDVRREVPPVEEARGRRASRLVQRIDPRAGDVELGRRHSERRDGDRARVVGLLDVEAVVRLEQRVRDALDVVEQRAAADPVLLA